MLIARRRFLEAGHFRRLQQTIAAIASRHLRPQPDGNRPVVVDVGCGDGSYLAAIAEVIKPSIPEVHLVGLDLSKDAARLTARRDCSWEVAVADVRSGLPLREAAVQVMLSVFAPRNAAAFSRALTGTGIAIIAVPSGDHLVELQHAVGLMRVEPMKLDRLVRQSAGDLALADVVSVDESLTLDAAAIDDVLMMTPNAWHLTEAHRRRAAALARLTVTASFRVAVFRQARSASARSESSAGGIEPDGRRQMSTL